VGPEDPLVCVHAGGIPSLDELRLHQSTVWRWNRAVYDAASGGHLRIEMRVLPAGPTVVDMVANAAFLLGLTLALAPDVPSLLPAFTFGQARRNFYQAARRGLGAELLWPEAPGERVRPVAARLLGERLLPLARRGLVEAAVSPAEADRWLAVVAGRITNGQTGAVWQRRAFEAYRRDQTVDEAARSVLESYLASSMAGRPVHEWVLP
jgi:hypothetical protein